MRRFSLPGLRLLGGSQWATGGAPALAHLPTIPTFQELRPAIEGELRRSRRYERPLAVLVVAPDASVASAVNGTKSLGHHTNGANGARDRNGVGVRYGRELDAHPHSEPSAPVAVEQPLHWAQLRVQLLGSVLCGTLRESDIVGYAVDVNEFVALLPECDDPAARRTIARLNALYVSRIGIGLRAGLALFPRDGLTLDDLVIHARSARGLIDHVVTAGGDERHNGNGGAIT
jgi:hypothetical protein